jgi:UDP-N-acetylglucosamine--N-acetylmuramyl-(pentapeptide) pyrophosphoryl-undecaprenol N-acetylglucosamine transferase
MPVKKIIIAAGGTGGHLFPAQVFACEAKAEGSDILFVAAGLTSNPYFHKELYAFRDVASSTPFGKKISLLMRSCFSLFRGVRQSLKIVKEFKPDLVVGFGSFHSFPALVAALVLRVPLVLFESNAKPGKVNRLFSKWARFSAVQFASTSSLLSGATIEVAMPCRWEKKECVLAKEEALAFFSLEKGRQTFLVFGGSQGALSVNRAFRDTAALLKSEGEEFQLIHITGHKENDEELKRFYAERGILASVKKFEEQMHLALLAADIAICRAGASTIAELIAFEVPAVLIPYPHAYAHQTGNARVLEEEIGGGRILLEERMSSASLALVIKECSADLQTMKKKIADFKIRNQKQSLYSQIREVIR